ncbi:MAG: hypothetical protein RMI83_04155 [Desulfurococcaceae archaeon]|nr:hypothetical protein [Sulfolobales archaeon]MDW8170280.1 hypothetical protein [Desulfurococcaceae archaeon]
MQSSRSSSRLTRLSAEVSKAEEWAKSASRELADYLKSSSNELLLTYSYMGYPAASILYWLLFTLRPDLRTLLMDADTASYYVLAYRSDLTIVVFTTKPDSAATIRITDSSRLTGARVMMVSPQPGERTRLYMRDALLKTVPTTGSEITTSLWEALLAYYTGLNIAQEGRREERLRTIANQGFSVIVEELVEKYLDSVIKALELQEIVITSGKLLEPASTALAKALKSRGVDASYTPISLLEPAGNKCVLIVSCSVEDHLVNEKKLSVAMSGGKILELRLNLDPLEAPIYVLILALYLEKELSEL